MLRKIKGQATCLRSPSLKFKTPMIKYCRFTHRKVARDLHVGFFSFSVMLSHYKQI